MERVYYILTGSGPEIEAIKAYQTICRQVQVKWEMFAKKYGGEEYEYLHNNGFLGIKFKKGICSTKEAKEAAPKGWIPTKSNKTAFRPKATELRDVYDEWGNLPRIPYGDSIGHEIGAKTVYTGSRMLWVGYEVLPKGRFILSCPLDKDLDHYVPKGPHKELSASEYIKLTKGK